MYWKQISTHVNGKTEVQFARKVEKPAVNFPEMKERSENTGLSPDEQEKIREEAPVKWEILE